MGMLRLILALSVVVAHVGGAPKLHTMGGQVAVQCFFVISGFYMALVLNEKYLAGDKGSYGKFISNRLLRLFPAYLFALLFAFLAHAALVGTGHGSNLIGEWSTAWPLVGAGRLLIQLANGLLIGQDAVMFFAVDPQGHAYFTNAFLKEPMAAYKFLVIPPAWSLAVELYFYAIAPWLVRRSLPIMAGVVAASFALRVAHVSATGFTNDPWSYRFFPFELAWFMLGAIAYRLYKRIPKGSQEIHAKKNLVVRSLIAIFIVLPYIQAIPKAFVYPFVVFAFLPYAFYVGKSDVRDRTIGELSYPVYILHWPIIELLKEFAYFGLTGWGRILIVFAIVIGVSWLVMHWIEKPIDLLRQKRAARQIGEPTAA